MEKKFGVDFLPQRVFPEFFLKKRIYPFKTRIGVLEWKAIFLVKLL